MKGEISGKNRQIRKFNDHQGSRAASQNVGYSSPPLLISTSNRSSICWLAAVGPWREPAKIWESGTTINSAQESIPILPEQLTAESVFVSLRPRSRAGLCSLTRDLGILVAA